MIKVLSILSACVLICYLTFTFVFFKNTKVDNLCNGLEIIVKDSLDKHFVTENDLLAILKRANLNPIDQKMRTINTDKIEAELLKNEMIAGIEVFKTPSGKIKLEVTQKIPILRIISTKGNYYIDNLGRTMPTSLRYAAHVPVASGHIEKEYAVNELYKFALFLQKNEFWDNQIEQIYINSKNEVELIPKVGNHRILMGTLQDYEEKLDHLTLFYKQVIPKKGWDKYNTINLKYSGQIVCTIN
ncbi:cell division protein FtsQ [Parabacteroides sp. PF5-9]|uniref:cell division protein FtsQ n=1 Tax=Parabacteroides sp. PF5-9 TaxID=1742404 RepID=UPI0024744148|nr:cell division protein FtsQ [Parabacteroides sp. PF5-9]MDH6359201.1 cell division protein FtsQ [Parabacteroides sp. PF5-9]